MATSNGTIHLRVLTGSGLKLSGGADTMALCGAQVAWDTATPVGPDALADRRTCRSCVVLRLETLALIDPA